MAAIAPRHVGKIGCDVLLLAAASGLHVPEIVKTEAVKRVGVGVQCIVEAYSVSRDTNLRVSRDDEAVREEDIFVDKAFKGDCV